MARNIRISDDLYALAQMEAMLQDRSIAQCVVLRTRDLFAAKRGIPFHPNPYSDYGREFLPHEIDCLLRTGTLGFTTYEQIPESEDPAVRPSCMDSSGWAARMPV